MARIREWVSMLWEWLRTFPRPWRVVRITGDVVSRGGQLRIGPGVTVRIDGNIYAPPIGIDVAATVTVTGKTELHVVGSLVGDRGGAAIDFSL